MHARTSRSRGRTRGRGRRVRRAERGGHGLDHEERGIQTRRPRRGRGKGRERGRGTRLIGCRRECGANTGCARPAVAGIVYDKLSQRYR